MRISTNNGEVIIRGKGINLNSLPVYDEGKQKYRPGVVSQNVAVASAKPREIQSRTNMEKFKIIKRIMDKTSCVGYVLEDVSGNTRRISRETVLKLAEGNRISNAVVSKTFDQVTGQQVVSLRGVNGCSLKQLPILIVEGGRIVDPSTNKSSVTIRAVRMKCAGQIVNNSSKSVDRFNVGDFIIVKVDGNLKVIPGTEFIQKYRPEKSCSAATCDNYLDCLSDYTIEIYGSNSTKVSPNQVKTWAMAKHV
jgi:hypothetical protein